MDATSTNWWWREKALGGGEKVKVETKMEIEMEGIKCRSGNDVRGANQLICKYRRETLVKDKYFLILNSMLMLILMLMLMLGMTDCASLSHLRQHRSNPGT
jgi:hypothetical protein